MKRRMVPIFDLEIWFSNEEADAREFIKKHDGDEKVCDDAEGLCHFWTDKEDRGWRIMCVFDGTDGTISHESFHMACEILEAIDAREYPPEEVKAHLIGWLMAEFQRAFGTKPKAPAPIKLEDAS